MRAVGKGNDVRDVFGRAKTLLGKREVFRNAENENVFDFGRHLVEFPHRHSANGGVETRKYVQEQTLARHTSEREVAEVGLDHFEVGGFRARSPAKIPRQLDGTTIEFCVHNIELFAT